MTKPSGEITGLLAEAVGAENLSGSVADTISHAVDFWPRALISARELGWPKGPTWVVWPGAAAEVAQVLRIASAHSIPVIPFGAGSSMVGGASPRGDDPVIVINTKRMSTLLDLDEVSLVAHVQAGVVGVELEERLNQHGFSLGHVPTSMTNATLGGWLSTRSAGLMSSRYGRISDMCLGLTAVLADGQVVHTRVAPRRATGPDLAHLLLGAEGTLGVITAAHLRLHQLPIHRQFDAFRFESLGRASGALCRLLARGVRPLVTRIQEDPRQRKEGDGACGEAAAEAVAEATAAAPVPAPAQDLAAQPDPACRVLMLAYEGPPDLVEAEASLAQEVALEHGGVALGPAPARRWWGQRFAGVFRIGPRLSEPRTIADQAEVGVRWSSVAPLEERLIETLEERGLSAHVVVEHARLESACLSVSFGGKVPQGTDLFAAYDGAWEALGRAVREAGGGMAHVFGGGRHRARYLEEGARERLALLASVKRQLDPAGIMNPGILGTEP